MDACLPEVLSFAGFTSPEIDYILNTDQSGRAGILSQILSSRISVSAAVLTDEAFKLLICFKGDVNKKFMHGREMRSPLEMLTWKPLSFSYNMAQ